MIKSPGLHDAMECTRLVQRIKNFERSKFCEDFGPFSSACGMSLASELKDAGVDKKVAEVFVKTTASVELFLATFRRALALRLVPQIFGFVCVQV